MRQQEALLGYSLVLPTVALVSLIIFYPVLYSVYLGFTQTSLDPGILPRFVGLENYRGVLTDPDFWRALGTTLIYTMWTVVGGTLLGLAVAILMNRPFRGRGLARGIVLMPYVAPVISLVFAWRYIFHPVYGFANYWLVDIIPIFDAPRNWIDSPAYALPMVILFDIWRQFPFAFLMILARLQSIPSSLYEAAEMDGAGGWAKFRGVTLPELSFVIGSVVVLRWIWNFNKFDEIWLLSKNVQTATVYVYLKGFQTYHLGEAAATSTVLVALLIVFVWVYVKKVLKW